MASIWDFLFGSEDKLDRVSNYSPEQENAFQKIMSMLYGDQGLYNQASSSLMDLLNPSSDAYNKFAAPYMRQFQEEIIPQLAEQYAAGAHGGALTSSGFGQALGSAGAGLQEKLAALRAGLQQEGRQQAFGQSREAMGYQPFSYYQRPGSMGLVPSLFGAAVGGLTQGLGGGLFNSLR